MPCGRAVFGLPVLALLLAMRAIAGPVVLFPTARELASPDGRFVVRSAEPVAAATEFVGTFHSLWVTEAATGLSRKLCDYAGLAAISWPSNDFLLVTDYMGKKTSRVMVFDIVHADNSAVLDVPTLIRILPAQWREALRQNDHLFVEASELVNRNLRFRVWGYGQHDPTGFSWKCEYPLHEGNASCHDQHGAP